MSKYIQYDPVKHKGLPLYEIQSETLGDIIATVAVKSTAIHEIAARMPWYYLVDEDDIIKDKQIVIVKGGPRSGNWGHSGKVGMWGGSNAGGGHGAVSPSKIPGGKKIQESRDLQQQKLPFKKKTPPVETPTDEKPTTAEAMRVAKLKLAKAQELEKKATPLVSGLAKEKGGELHGLKYKLKTDKSLAEKIENDVAEKGISHDEAADKINDAVRYTILFDRENFVERVTETQALLEEKGWRQYDTKYKNFFAPGDAYDGYNTVVENVSTGERFELQYHTPESIAIKEKIHPWYKEFQNLPKGTPRRLELFENMRAEWENYERPVNWENLLGAQIKGKP